jgi:hypothetical protein
VSKLLRRLVRWWLLSSVVNVLLVELVQSMEALIVESNIGIHNPPALR